MKNTKTSWGKVANWYDGVVNDDDSYQQKVLLPNLLRVLDLNKNDEVLDIACGQGLFSHETAKMAKSVKGFDIGKSLIDIANKNASKNENFIVASADKAFPYGNGVFSKAFCVLALQNIKNIQNVFTEAKRVLKKGGKFVLVLNHPAFRVPQGSDWGFDQKQNRQYRKIYNYMSEKTVSIVMNPGKGGGDKTVSFHRPLQTYFKEFAKNGFVVSRLEEWISHKESQRGPRKIAEDSSRKEIPMFLMIETTS